MAATWSSCAEAPIQRMHMGLCAWENLRMHGCDIRDAYAHSPAPLIDTCLTTDDACANWCKQRFGKEISKRDVLPVLHCLQGHPESGHIHMRFINKILIEKMGFSTTTHDRCICRKMTNGNLVLILRQVDDILVGCKEESLAKEITSKIGSLVAFQTERDKNDLPIEFFGLVDEFNGVDIDQFISHVSWGCVENRQD